MSSRPRIIAVNGSPHAGIGATAQMIEMLRPGLSEEGLELEVIHLSGLDIEYCRGCGFCMEKGRCWIDDDHRGVVSKILSADGVILGSPVYFFSVTGQMKTFLDRCLAFGHKPRPTWKPGLAVCPSAGMGETDVAHYLAFVLRTFGAFAVGTLTAIAAHPGGFWGREAVETRAMDLAKDLARAIREKRRFPPTDRDLRYYQFMSGLVESHKETVMKDDYQHWKKQGLFEGFASYIQQDPSRKELDPEMREAWIQEMIAEQKARKKGQQPEKREMKPRTAQTAKSCNQILRNMPLAFKAEAAGDLKAVYQFEVSGAETFTAHLRIAEGKCSFHEGAAERPDIIIRAPADVWLKISQGELDGQKAFMEGRFETEGNIMLLLKLKSLFS